MNSFDKKVLDRLSETIPLDNWENVRDTIRRAVALARKEILEKIEAKRELVYKFEKHPPEDKEEAEIEANQNYGILSVLSELRSFLQEEEKQGGGKK